MPNNIPISIPAFREEGDGSPFLGLSYQPKISIPAFREEGDREHTAVEKERTYFNPRLP